MNIFFKMFCRTYQFCFKVAMPVLPYREPKKYFSIDQTGEILKEIKSKSALLVTDKFLSESEFTGRIIESAKKSGVSLIIYNNVKPNPTVDNCEEAKKAYLQGNCDCIIAFGGGSSMDCAKATGALISYPKKNLSGLKGLLRVMRSLPPLVAIPTTSGTGSEVTPTSVITDAGKSHKYTINSFPLIPHYAILDPEVTYTLPAHLTATTGIDALTHAVEAYIGNSTTKETRAYAKKAVKLIFENLETAFNNPTDKNARENMLNASYMAGIAFSKSYVGYIHAVAHSLGGMYDVPHGLANSVIMPYVLRMYGKSIHKKLSELAIEAGVAARGEDKAYAAEKFINAIESLNERLNIPKTIDGIKQKDIPIMAKHASKEGNPLYPVPVLMDAKELEKIYHKVADWRK